MSTLIIDRPQDLERIQIYMPIALLTLANHCKSFMLKDSDYTHNEQGEIIAVSFPPHIHAAAVAMAVNMVRFSGN